MTRSDVLKLLSSKSDDQLLTGMYMYELRAAYKAFMGIAPSSDLTREEIVRTMRFKQKRDSMKYIRKCW